MIFVHALGTAQIDAGTACVKPTSTRRFALLLYLAAEKGRRVSRTTLHDLICPDQSEKNALHTIRELVYQLRQSSVPILSDTHGLTLASGSVRSDYHELIEADSVDQMQLRAAEGGFLPGYAPTHSEAFSEWYEGFRARMVFDLCKAVLRELTRGRLVGDWTLVEHGARACLALDPLNEEAILVLAETLALGGAKTQAVDLLDDYMRDVGSRDSNLKISAALLRRRISESEAPSYALRRILPFVGRTKDLELMHGRFRLSREGHAQCVMLEGEPGVGKSRLVDEFAKAIQLTRVSIGRIAAQPGDNNRPLGALIELIPQLLAAPGALGCRPESMKWLQSLIDVDGDIERTLPDVAAYRTTRAIADIVDAIVSEQSLVLIIEDAHWLDTASIRVLLSLCGQNTPRRLFIVVTSRRRIEGAAAIQKLEHIQEHALVGLDPGAASSLIESALRSVGIVPTPEEVAWIRDLSLGNPLFIATSAAEYARRRDRAAVPDSLTGLIATRLIGFPEDTLTVLGIIVLLGKHSSVDRLCRALNLGGLNLLASVRQLERASLVIASDSSINPTHALVSEAFLRRCSKGWLLAAHHQVATVLTEDFADSGTPALLWECAEHWIEAGERDRAREFLIRCADHATSIGRPDAAASILERALGLENDPAQAIAIARRIMVEAYSAGDAGTVLVAVDALRDMNANTNHDDLELIEFGARLRTRFADDEVEARVSQCVSCHGVSDVHRLRAATLALKYADTRGKPALARFVCSNFDPSKINCQPQEKFEHEMLRALVSDDFERAASLCQRTIESLRDLDDWTRARYLDNASIGFARCGRYAESLAALSESVAATSRFGATKAALRSNLAMALLLYDLNRDAEADRAFAHVSAIVTELPEADVDMDLQVSRIDVALFKEDIETASTNLDRFISSGHQDEFRTRWIRVFKARIQQLKGQAIDADSLAEFAEGRMIGPAPGLCDLEVATAINEWLRLDKPSTAQRVLRAYEARRRWKNPFSKCLQIATARLEQKSLIPSQDDFATASRRRSPAIERTRATGCDV